MSGAYPPPGETAAREFRRFTLVGAAGFFVDAGALMLATHDLGFGFYAGRAFSYLCAATFTWFCNRRFTFAPGDGPPAREWLRFLGANALGGAINYGVYAAIIAASGGVGVWPLAGVAAGSAAGLVFNFTISKAWVFRRG